MRGLALAGLLVAWLAVAVVSAATGGQPAGGGDTTDWSKCLACHHNEGVNLPKLSDLRPLAPGSLTRAACMDCHKAAELSVTHGDLRHPVRPLNAHVECTGCHEAVPHAKGAPPPLPLGDYNWRVCLACHRDIDAKLRMVSTHGRHPQVTCRRCHAPHKPLQAALPSVLVPQSIRGQWTAGYDWQTSNAACFDCHTAAETMVSLLAGFITLNTENYHERHVVRGRILCVECHDPHGSMQPMMIRGQTIGGELLLYRKTPDGGNCDTVCHGVQHNALGYRNRLY